MSTQTAKTEITSEQRAAILKVSRHNLSLVVDSITTLGDDSLAETLEALEWAAAKLKSAG